MADSWFVVPQTTRVDLPDGQWIELKNQLTYGEQRAAQAALYQPLPGGGIAFNYEMAEISVVMGYLVDWSLRGLSGEPVRIDSDAKKLAALRALAPAKFKVIHAAVEAHADAIEAVTGKNDQSTAIASAASSASVG